MTPSRAEEYEAAAVRALNTAAGQEGEPVLSQIAGAAVYAILALAAAIRERA